MPLYAVLVHSLPRGVHCSQLQVCVCVCLRACLCCALFFHKSYGFDSNYEVL